jgi:hypothetical protein
MEAECRNIANTHTVRSPGSRANVLISAEGSQVLFQSEPLNREDARRRAVYQLLNKEQQYSLCLQFGLSRFLVPLSERRDLLNANEHYTLFQNAEEVRNSFS